MLPLDDIFAYQYLVSPTGTTLSYMDQIEFSDMTINVGKRLARGTLLDRNQKIFAHVLGIAVDDKGLIEDNTVVDQLDVDDPDFFERFERYLNNIAGRYVIVCSASGQKRLYTDPISMIGCVVNNDARLAGSSLDLVLDREIQLNTKYDHEINERRGGKYTLFHTRDEHINRLNGSYYLDLATFRQTRFWPKIARFERPVQEYGEIYDEIIKTAQHSTKNVIQNFDTALPLSGGRDSRLILGMAGEHVHDVTQCFSHITNYATRVDNAISKILANEVGLHHETHSWRAPPPPSRTKFEYRQAKRVFRKAVGAPIGLTDELEKNVQQFLHPHQVILRGHLTDLLRAVYVFTSRRKRWNEFQWQIQRLLPVPVDDFDDEVFQRLLPDFKKWRHSLPPSALELPLDFMFLEVYYNSTVGFTFNGFHQHFYMSPFNSRKLIELSLAINVDYRRTAKPVDDILYRIDPKLCAVPYFKESGADLQNLELDSDWKKFTKERMADIKDRYENGYRIT